MAYAPWTLFVRVLVVLAAIGGAGFLSGCAPSGVAVRGSGADTPETLRTTAAPTAAGRLVAPRVGPGGQRELTAKGKLVFEQTAGGVGCAFCHGIDGRGKAEFAAPNIRGKTAAEILAAIETRPQMNIVKLTDEELRAVGAYLSVLAGTP